MSFTPGKIAQTKINQPQISQPAPQPEKDYVVISVSETEIVPAVDPYAESLPVEQPSVSQNTAVEPSIEMTTDTVTGEQVYEQPVVEVSSDLASIVY